MRLNRFTYSYTLLTLLIALYLAPAQAQTKTGASKPPAKKTAKKTVKLPPQKAAAKSLGDAAAKIKVKTDTTKKASAGTNANGSLSEEIVVTTAYKPVLADAVKIRRNPNLEDKTPFKAPLTYTPVDRRLELNTEIRPIVAMQRPPERDSDLTDNYVKAGLGSLKTTYGELYINNGRDQALQVGGYLKHFAQNGNYYRQNTDNGSAGVFIKSIGATNAVNAKIDYSYNSNYFWGYDESGVPPSNLLVDKQHFNNVGAEVELAKNFKDEENAFTYAFKLKGYIFSDAFQKRENNVILSGFLNETIKQFYAGLAGSVDLSTQKDSAYDYNNSFIRLNPYIKFQGDNYKIDAGVNIVNEFGFKTAVYVFPAAKLELQVIPGYVRVFVEAKGDVNRSSLRDFSMVNPYLGADVPIQNSVDQLDISAGLKGTILPGLGFKVAVFRNTVKNLPLFVSDFNFAAGYNRFTVIYDEGRTRINGLNGELDYKASDDVDIFGKVEFKNYQMGTPGYQPWNLPKFKLTAGTVVHINNKLQLNGTLLFRGAVTDPFAPPNQLIFTTGVNGVNNTANATAPSTTTTTNGTATYTTISSFADVSVGADYKITNRFSVFVHANNLLNGTHQVWLYYPDYGFNIFGGVGYAF